MPLRIREQDRAQHALSKVSLVNNKQEYTRRAQNLPSMIQNLGLAGTIAFLLGKEAAEKQLADHLAEWLLDPHANIPWPPQALAQQNDSPAKRLEYAIGFKGQGTETSWMVYRLAAREARLYAGWLKRWSKADS